MQDNKDVFRRIERQYYRDRMGALGLSTVEGMLLRWLGKQGQTRQEDLVVQLVLDKGAVARALARLEELGLVERAVSDRCRREKLVSPTPEGLVLAGAIQQSVDEWNAVCFQGFSPPGAGFVYRSVYPHHPECYGIQARREGAWLKI